MQEQLKEFQNKNEVIIGNELNTYLNRKIKDIGIVTELLQNVKQNDININKQTSGSNHPLLEIFPTVSNNKELEQLEN